jgi:signal transduction histidine kinase
VVRGPGVDVRARAFDGRELELNASAAPLREPDGRITGAVIVLRDLTERNRLAREREAARADELTARETSRRMEAFLATAAHDLRAPLTALVGSLDLAERQIERLAATVVRANTALAPRVAAARGWLGEAAQGAERLARLLNVLFATAALRADKLELHRAPCALLALVRTQVAALRVAAPARSIRLQAPSDSEEHGAAIPVELDADRVGQVVTNSLPNALKYSPPDRPVEVWVAVRTGQVRVAVRDEGPGLPKPERGRVWELFHRAPGVEVQDTARGGQPRARAVHQYGDRRGARRAGRGRERSRSGVHLLVHPAPGPRHRPLAPGH